MTNEYNPNLHHRRSIRLKDYDYTQAGAYFVTICMQNMECLFGDIMNEEMRLNEYGRIVEKEWLQTAVIRANVELDEFVVMPNHFHGILVLTNNDGDINGGRGMAQHDKCRGVLQYAPTEKQIFRSPSQTIGAIIRGFKSAVTKQINQIRGTHRLPVWQRNYYEHVVRNENELNKIREYIVNNPLQWALDENNPDFKGGINYENKGRNSWDS